MDTDLKAIHQSLGISPDYMDNTLLTAQTTPTDLVSIGVDVYGRLQRLREPAARAWTAMQQQAFLAGVEIQVVSAYRSLEYQVELIQRLLARGQEIRDILTRVAAPGYSEHQSGCALDLTTPSSADCEEEFENTEAFRWLQQSAAEFEFYLSYSRDNPYGVIYEPWHWCYKVLEQEVE